MARFGVSSSSSRSYSSGLTSGATMSDFETRKSASLSTYGSGSYNASSYSAGRPLVTRDYQIAGSGGDVTDAADLLSSRYSYSTSSAGGPTITEASRASSGSGSTIYTTTSTSRTITPGGTRVVRDYSSSTRGAVTDDPNAANSRGFSSTLVTNKKTVTTTESTEGVAD